MKVAQKALTRGLVNIFTKNQYAFRITHDLEMLWKQRGFLKSSGPPSKMGNRDFPHDPAVKNPPANAGDMGWTPGPGRSHMLWGN